MSYYFVNIRGCAKYARSRRKLAKALAAKRKYARRLEAGGARWLLVAKICKLWTNTVLGSQTHLLRHKRNLTPHIPIYFCCRLGTATLRGVFAKICIPHPGRMGQLAKICNGDYPGADCENMRSAKIILSPYAPSATHDFPPKDTFSALFFFLHTAFKLALYSGAFSLFEFHRCRSAPKQGCGCGPCCRDGGVPGRATRAQMC